MSYFDKIKDKAVFIRLPNVNRYLDYKVDGIIDFPIVDEKYFYRKWNENGHHYTTEYHREILLPKLNEIFKFGLNIERDFHLVENNYMEYDITMLFPNEEIHYEVFEYTKNEHVEDCLYSDLVNKNGSDTPTEYHKLYKHGHVCSRLINKNTQSQRKILIDGDSQMIPSIMPLSVYFKELWYFDNRTSKSFENELNNCEFTDILVQFNFNGLDKYINNLR